MYEQLMIGKNSDKFFTLLDAVFSENSKRLRNAEGLDQNKNVDIPEENEWMQEYHLIYNSYILDNKEILGNRE